MSRFTFLTINFLLFHTCWMATAYGAGLGLAWLGPVFVIPALLLHLLLLEDGAREILFLVLAAVVGFLIEGGLFFLGVFQYAFHPEGFVLPPYWSFTLWLIFATLFHGSLYWIRGQVGVQVLLGAILGPFSYYSAAALDVIVFEWTGPWAVVTIAAVWGFLLPLLSYIAYETYPFSEIRIDSLGPNRIPDETS